MTSSADRTELELREHASLLVRAGLETPEGQVAALAEVVREQMPDTDAEVLARAWWIAADRDHARLSATWAAPTDHDQFLGAVAECRDHDVLVLLGSDEVAVRADLERVEQPVRGALWCTSLQVHTAISTGVLDLQLWTPAGTTASEGDGLATAVVSCVERHGLPVRWHEDRVQVATWWRRRP